jgi:ABC-type dipeptide/oligopeptide/nickel transport system permease component
VPIYQDPLTNLAQFVLPAVAIGYRSAGVTARMVRSSMLEVLGQDYIRTARAKGLQRQAVILRHALTNALIPVITVVGAQLGFLIGGAAISETIFSLPGVGRLFLDSVAQRDYTVIQGVVLFIAVVVILINLLVDLLYGVIDPRIRYQ